MSEQPYIKIDRMITEYKYNPNYGDSRICVCGHVYVRHFDPYENMDAVGCKHCHCGEFNEMTDGGINPIACVSMGIAAYKNHEPYSNPFDKNTEYYRHISYEMGFNLAVGMG